jgi:RNA polymerase sigma factor (sigma-70 family)
MNRILTRLTRAAVDPTSWPDGQLLDTFLAERSESAFRELVARHGSLVFAVCNRVLRHRQDAEDAFQAVFLVLARRAADVWPRDAVGSWLYGVAHRVALKARSLRARRRVCEQPLGEQTPASPPVSASPDLAELIDSAVRKLPEAYRAAVIACDLEGLSRAEAAARLGWKEGTLSGRLARGRKLLADRLRRGGVALPAGSAGVALGTGEALGADVVAETVRLAIGSCGQNLASGVSLPVAVLTEGVVRGMFLAKIKAAAVAVLAVGLFGVGVWASTGAGSGAGEGVGIAPAPVAAVEPKPPAKRHPDLDAMQGTWWILAIGDGNKLQHIDPNKERDPRQFAVTIRDDQFYFPRHPAFKEVFGVGKITLDPTRTPKHIDIAHEGGTFPGTYDFVALKPKDDLIQLRLSLPRPGGVRSHGFMKGGLGAVEMILGRHADPLRDPTTNAGLLPGAKHDLTAAAERHEFFRNELELALGDMKARDPAKDLDRFELLLERDKARLNAAMQLLDQAETELVKARLRVKPAPKLPVAADPDLPDPLKDAKARREIEKQRALLLRDHAKQKVADAQAEKEVATVRATEAEVKLAEAKQNLTAVQLEYDTLFPNEKPDAPLELRDDAGKRIPFSEEAAREITEVTIAMLAGSRGELTGGKGTPFATAQRWQQLQKTGHVVVRFPEKTHFADVANNARVEATEILVPISVTRSPEFILIRSGDTYRAFFDFPPGYTVRVQKALSTLAK